MIPRFVFVALVVAVASLLLVAVGAWEMHHISDREARHDCERAVGFRDDNRAMWVYLVDTNGGTADPDRLHAFVAELNKRLPELRCEGGKPVPVTE